MANKLTGKKLEELIMEVLKEESVRIRVPIPSNNPSTKPEVTDWLKKVGVGPVRARAFGDGDNAEQRAADIIDTIKNDIADLDGDPSDWTNTDMDKAYKKNITIRPANSSRKGEIAKKTTMKQFIDSIAKSTEGPWADYKKVALTDPSGKRAGRGTINPDQDMPEFETTSITKPRIYTAPNDTASGKVLGSQNALINSIFKKETIAGRLREIDILTNDIFNNPKWYQDNKNKPRQLMQAVMFMDLMEHMLKETSGLAGDVTFEAFCALLCGGEVLGADMKAADFKTNTGKLGSSKFYQNYSNIKQSSKNFKEDDEVHYIIAIKKGTETQQSAVSAYAGGTTSSAEITYVDLHYVIVQCTKVPTSRSNFYTFKTHNYRSKELSEVNYDGGDIDIIAGEGSDPKNTYVGTIRMISGDVPWQQEVETNLDDGTAKQAFAASKQFFSNLFKAEEQSKKYISLKKDSAGDIISAGNAALKAYDDADISLKKMVELLAPDSEKVQGGRGSRELKKENKKNQTKSLKDLDKLIERVIIESMNKK